MVDGATVSRSSRADMSESKTRNKPVLKFSITKILGSNDNPAAELFAEKEAESNAYDLLRQRRTKNLSDLPANFQHHAPPNIFLVAPPEQNAVGSTKRGFEMRQDPPDKMMASPTVNQHPWLGKSAWLFANKDNISGDFEFRFKQSCFSIPFITISDNKPAYFSWISWKYCKFYEANLILQGHITWVLQSLL